MRECTNYLKVLGISLTSLICALAKYGVGQHVVYVPFADAYMGNVLGFCVRTVHIVVLTTTKLSICLFYRRIFQDSLSKISSVVLMAFMTVFTVVLFIDGMFACNLKSAFWSPAGRKCANPFPKIAFFIYGSATLSVVVDLLLMAFALWRIFPLWIARAQKISLYVIISLGWLAIAASLVRAILIGKIIKSEDPTCEIPPPRLPVLLFPDCFCRGFMGRRHLGIRRGQHRSNLRDRPCP